ncbi:MAG: hypothetical protein EAZ44_02055 [Cytophagia bacterium]|nr:MAG: hypothetical protein EAZ44_02055 [Cytophagia bacterium]TAG42718.1 MAG: hypothetical protein EAZ31_05585 [Cytophagia bacterium]
MENYIIFDLLDEAFDDISLKTFCFKYFEKVYNSIPAVQNKEEKITFLITHCKSHLQLDFLLEKIKKERPAMYQKHIPIVEVKTKIENISKPQEIYETPKITTKPQNYTETINGVSFEMIWVEGTDTNNPFLFQGTKKVQLDGFYVAKFPTTQALYQAIIGTNPSYFKGGNKPVECVNWFDAMAFTEKLSELTGKKYILPSEVQWEYAAKGGRLSKDYTYAGSNNIDEVACYRKNSRDKGEKHADYGTHNVGRYKANELGIYDMSGNVWEWCLDEWENNIVEKIPDNFLNPLFSENKIINSNTFKNKNTANTTQFVDRGGAYFFNTGNCAVRYRRHNDAGNRDNFIGFRCVLVF